MAAVEILFACGPIKSLIEKGDFDAIPDAIEKNGQQGCQTFDQSLLWLYQQGKITREDALSHAESAANLRLKMSPVEPPNRVEATKAGEQIKQEETEKFRIKGLEPVH